MTQQTKQQDPAIFTLFVLTAFASVAAVLYTPALPAIMRDLHVSANTVQLTMTLFMVGYAAGQWLYGPITRRIGRKPTLYIGIIISIIGALLCALAGKLHSFNLFLTARIIQALGTSVGLVLAFAIINDVYQGDKVRKVIAYATLAFAVLPGIAVFVGGVLVDYFSWESCFYFLSGYSLIVLWLVSRLPETCKEKDPNALQLKEIILRYGALIKNIKLVSYAGIWGMSTIIIYVFATAAPLISGHLLGASAMAFGIANLTTSAALILGNLVSTKLVGRFSARQAMLMSLVLAMLGALLLLFFDLMKIYSLVSMFIAVDLIYFALPMIFSNAGSLATSDVDDKATASSLVTLINMSMPVVGLLVVQSLHYNLFSLISIAFVVIILLALLLYWNVGRKEVLIAKKTPA